MSSEPSPGRRLRPLPAWFALAVAVSLVLPAGVLARWGQDPVIRRALLPYVAVLLAQVGTEGVLLRRRPRGTIVVSGAVFTGLRLWQLGRARRDLRRAPTAPGRRVAERTVLAGLAFWMGNFGVLAATQLAERRRR